MIGMCLLWLPYAHAKLEDVETSSPDPARHTDLMLHSISMSARIAMINLNDMTLCTTHHACRYWQSTLHDMHEGYVTGLAMAYDDSCIVSAAADGTVLLIHNPLGPSAAAQTVPQPAAPNDGLPSMSEVKDTLNPGVTTVDPQPQLSLEEAKQAAHQHQQAATAAAARQQLVVAVEGLRRDLAGLMRENAARPPCQRLPAEAFHLDPGVT